MSEKFVWAIDPFSDQPKLVKTAALFAKALSKATKLKAEPLYVVSPAELKVSYRVESIQADKMIAFAESRCAKILSDHAWPALLPSRVLYEPALSLSASALTAAKYAKRSEAEFIYVSTHSTGGAGLGGTGSFTNTLMASSSVPVLSVRRGIKPSGAPKRILFATDFSAASTKALERLCVLAKHTRSQIIICHAFFRPLPWIPYDYFYMSTPQVWEDDYIKAAIAEQKQKGEKLVRLAADQGVRATFSLQETTDGVAPMMLKAAKKHKADWIALAGEGGKFRQYVLGTAAQRIVHSSPIPVWIYKTT